MTLAQARACLLMGRPESWGGRGGKPIGTVPDGVLRQAKAFFLRCLKDGESKRMEEQVMAIDVVLADREEHSPQARLAL